MAYLLTGFTSSGFEAKYLNKILNFFFILLRTWLGGLRAPLPVLFLLFWARQGMSIPEILKLVLQSGVVLSCEDAGDELNLPLRL
jgi:hypothetical protein